ncbi:MAG: hypothetical protein ABIJ40_06640 [Bacteroidota bacterium]
MKKTLSGGQNDRTRQRDNPAITSDTWEHRYWRKMLFQYYAIQEYGIDYGA